MVLLSMRSVKTLTACVVVFFSLFTPYAFAAAAYNWDSVVIGGGGFVTGIIYHPSVSGLAYMRTDMGGAYRWDSASTKWTPITDFLDRTNSDYMGILSIAVDPNSVNKVYLMCGKYTDSWAGNGAVLASNDRGATWSVNPLSFKVGGNEYGRGAGERLQVDPNLGSVLFMGSGGDAGSTSGLWKSTNSGTSWTQVSSFSTSANVNFVLIDKTSGTSGSATPRIFVAVNNTSGATLYRSDNGGTSWTTVAGQPNGVMAMRGVIANGYLYMTFANSPGPNDATAGSVWRYTISGGAWTNITPATGSYGYGGISVDAQNSNHILVTTMDLWWPSDQVWRSTNGGTSWTRLIFDASNNDIATYDHTYAPWAAARTIHWLADIEIDPFNSAKAQFVTGYGVYACDNVAAATTNWVFRDSLLEEMVPIEIVAPPSGPILLSAMGDQGGFRHDSLAVSPAGGFYSPDVGTTLSIDYAETVPAKIVKAFNVSPYGAYSTNSGTSWTNFSAAPGGTNAGGSKAIAISADGTRMVWAPSGGSLSYSTNNGSSWTACTGITTTGYYPESDRVNSNKFYYYDPVNGRLWYSTNGGAAFTQSATVYPTLAGYQSYNGSANTVFGREGDVWITTGAGGLYRSTNSGVTGAKISSVDEAYTVGFGKASGTYPAIYLHGIVGGVLGIFRSDDTGATWTQINDAQHQYGWIHCIKGDQNVYGRCFISIEGRGIAYGVPAASGSPTFTPTYTRTPANTATLTWTLTRTPSHTQTGTPTPTRTPASTNTHTPTFTWTLSSTLTYTRTGTPTLTWTLTHTNTGTFTPVNTATRTGTPTMTWTLTHTNTGTFTPANTATRTGTPTMTWTLTHTNTGTFTPVNTATRTGTPTMTWTLTHTNTGTFTPVNTGTGTATPTLTPVDTSTSTPSLTATRTASPTMTWTMLSTPENTATLTFTQVSTATGTGTATLTSTPTLIPPTATLTSTRSFTLTATATATDSPYVSPTVTPTGTPPSPTFTPSFSATATITQTATMSFTTAATASETFTPTKTETRSFTPTFTATPVNTATRTQTVTLTRTPTSVPPTPTLTATLTSTLTATSTSQIPTSTTTSTPTSTPLAPTLTATSTPVPFPTADKLQITDTRPYPNPYVPGSGSLSISYSTTRATTNATLLLYTSSYRLVAKYTDTADKAAGPCVMQAPAAKFAKAGRGTYYGVIEAKGDNGDTARSAVFVVIINR